jgi:hypothetical protein
MAIRDLTPDEWAKTVRSAGAGYASCTPAPDYSRIVASPTGHMMDAPSCCPDNPAEARFCRHCGTRIRRAFPRTLTDYRPIPGKTLASVERPRIGDAYPNDPGLAVQRVNISPIGDARPWWAFWRKRRPMARVDVTYAPPDYGLKQYTWNVDGEPLIEPV